MHFTAGIKAVLLLAASIPAQAWNRLDKDNAVSCNPFIPCLYPNINLTLAGSPRH